MHVLRQMSTFYLAQTKQTIQHLMQVRLPILGVLAMIDPEAEAGLCVVFPASPQSKLHCAAQHMFWSSLYGSVLGEDGRWGPG